MAKFNGNDLVLAIGDGEATTPVLQKFAHSTTASISFSNSLIDVTTKDSMSWEEMISGRKSFTISAEGLADFNDVSSATSTEQFSDLALPGTLVAFTFEKASSVSGVFLGYSGNARIESFEISAPSDDSATYSVSLKGTGELKKASVA